MVSYALPSSAKLPLITSWSFDYSSILNNFDYDYTSLSELEFIIEGQISNSVQVFNIIWELTPRRASDDAACSCKGGYIGQEGGSGFDGSTTELLAQMHMKIPQDAGVRTGNFWRVKVEARKNWELDNMFYLHSIFFGARTGSSIGASNARLEAWIDYDTITWDRIQLDLNVLSNYLDRSGNAYLYGKV